LYRIFRLASTPLSVPVIDGFISHILFPFKYMKAMDEPSKKARLEEAAEALVRAAVSVSETASLAIGRDVAKKLDKLDKLEGVSEDIVSLKESSDAKLNMIHQDICNLKDEMAKVSQALKTEAKVQRIQFAIDHVEKRQNIEYSHANNYKSIRELLTPVLWQFMQGFGYYLPDNAIFFNVGETNTEVGYEAFRSKVVTELHALLGKKPRLNKEANGKYAVFYD
jgi:hypothetical protein